jgi:hypothetical protein
MTIKLKKELSAKVATAAGIAGYSSAQEFIEHVLEREADRIVREPGGEADEEVVRRLKGLGYID